MAPQHGVVPVLGEAEQSVLFRQSCLGSTKTDAMFSIGKLYPKKLERVIELGNPCDLYSTLTNVLKPIFFVQEVKESHVGLTLEVNGAGAASA